MEKDKEFNYIQKFWYKDKMLYQNCGIDTEMVGEYNGYSIWQQKDNENYEEVLHAQLQGSKPLTIKEMKEKIILYEKLDKDIFNKIAEDEEDEEDF